MIRAELAPHLVGEGAEPRMNGPPVMMKPQAALFMSLVMHELATNAAKYGALSVVWRPGRVAWNHRRCSGRGGSN